MSTIDWQQICIDIRNRRDRPPITYLCEVEGMSRSTFDHILAARRKTPTAPTQAMIRKIAKRVGIKIPPA